MPTPQSDLLQGTLDALILKALALQQLHGRLPPNRADDQRDVRRKTRLSLSCSPSHGAGLLAYILLGRVREQSPCKILLR